MRLADKVALVIGAGSGIGQAIAVRFAAEGARVAVADISPETGAETVEMAYSAGGEAQFFPVDITKRTQVRDLLADVEERFNRVDVLVNSAGIRGRGRIETVPDDLWDRVVAVNLSGVFWACRYAIPVFQRVGGGKILNLASAAGLRGWQGSAIYSATKGGVVMLSRSLAADYARENIRVWALCPTAVDTPMIRDNYFAPADDPDAARRAFEKQEPMGRLITTDEMAALAVYLASDEGPPYTPDSIVV